MKGNAVPLLAVVVVLIGLLSAVDLLRTITGARGVLASADQPQTSQPGAPRPAATMLTPMAVARGQSADGDVIDSAA